MKDVLGNTKLCTTHRLDNVVSFERDAAFYLKKGMLHYKKNRVDKALFYFQKAVDVDPRDPFNHYNFACMLSKMGQLKEANRVFLHIIDDLDENMTVCYFLLAINYGLLEDMEKSQEYLELYLQLDPEGELAYEASELLAALDDEQDGQLRAYAERDLYMEKMLLHTPPEEFKATFRHSKGFRHALRGWLYDGPDEFKEDILRFYGELGNEIAKTVLLDFVKNPWIKERFRQLALVALKKMAVEERIQVFYSGQICEVDLANYPISTPEWRQEWQQVIDCAMKNMRSSNSYEDGFFDDVQAIWLDFINMVYPKTPRIVKIETWAAALEYSLARFHYLNLTQKDLANEYGVSSTSISNKFKEINQALQLGEKAYRNMLSFIWGEHE